MRRPYIDQNSKKITKTIKNKSKITLSKKANHKLNKNKLNQPKKNNKSLLIFLTFGFLLTGLANYLILNDISLDSFIKIKAFPETLAAKNSQSEKDLEKKDTTDESNDISLKKEEDKDRVNNNDSYYVHLVEKKNELDEREAKLKILDAELQEKKKELLKKMEELDKMRADITRTLASRIKTDEEKITKLVDFYSNMKPQQAAQVFNNLNEDLAVEILEKMKKKNAANIMNLLKPEKALKISEKFAGYN
jgi:flagellar motility protein MotE (MotC chaperone)